MIPSLKIRKDGLYKIILVVVVLALVQVVAQTLANQFHLLAQIVDDVELNAIERLDLVHARFEVVNVLLHTRDVVAYLRNISLVLQRLGFMERRFLTLCLCDAEPLTNVSRGGRGRGRRLLVVRLVGVCAGRGEMGCHGFELSDYVFQLVFVGLVCLDEVLKVRDTRREGVLHGRRRSF